MSRYSIRLPSAVRRGLMLDEDYSHRVSDFFDTSNQLWRRRIVRSNNIRLLRAFYAFSQSANSLTYKDSNPRSGESPPGMCYASMVDDIEETIVYGCKKAMLFIAGFRCEKPSTRLSIAQETRLLLIKWGRLDWIQELHDRGTLPFTYDPVYGPKWVSWALIYMQPEVLTYLVHVGNIIGDLATLRSMYVLYTGPGPRDDHAKAEIENHIEIMRPTLLSLRNRYPWRVPDGAINLFHSHVRAILHQYEK